MSTGLHLADALTTCALLFKQKEVLYSNKNIASICGTRADDQAGASSTAKQSDHPHTWTKAREKQVRVASQQNAQNSQSWLWRAVILLADQQARW